MAPKAALHVRRLAGQILVLVALAAMAVVHAPADAADARTGIIRASTVRVVQVALAGETFEVVHGTGIVVAPGLVLTNEHVVRDISTAEHEKHGYLLVPSVGDKRYPAQVVAQDAESDLALLKMDEVDLPPALFSSLLPEVSMGVTAVGYPGNVDRAMSRDILSLIQPTPPLMVDSSLSFVGPQNGRTVLISAVQIGPGFSGGPLLDDCGRVIGINNRVTLEHEGDAHYGFTIPASEVQEFLSANNVPYRVMSTRCPSANQLVVRLNQLREGSAQRAQSQVQYSESERQKSERAWRDYDQCRDEARSRNLTASGVLLLLALIAAGFAGQRLHHGRRGPAAIGGIFSVACLVAIGYFVLSPSGCVRPGERAAAPERAMLLPEVGSASCRFNAAESLNPYSEAKDVELTLAENGCVNDKRAYWRDGSTLKHGSINGEDRSAATIEIDRETGEFRRVQYVLERNAFDRLAERLEGIPEAQCSGGERQQKNARARVNAIAEEMRETPAEILVWSCRSN